MVMLRTFGPDHQTMPVLPWQDRSKLVPNVPTLAEAGIDFPPFGWWGLAGPKGLPQPVVRAA